MKPYVVVFAGVPGSSKSTIANYLSWTFDLPIFSSDNIRYEVREDLLVDDINVPTALAEYEKRLDARKHEVLETGRSIIFDSSVDRKWPETKELLIRSGYKWFLINIELTRPFLENLYAKTGRQSAIQELDHYLPQHQAFIEQYTTDIHLQITDNTFSQRLDIAVKGLQNFINSL